MTLRRPLAHCLLTVGPLLSLLACDPEESSIGAQNSGGGGGMFAAGGSATAGSGGVGTVAAGGQTLPGSGGSKSSTGGAADCSLPTSCEPGADSDPGVPVKVGLNDQQQTEVQELRLSVSEATVEDGRGLSARYPALFPTELGYDGTQAAGLDRLQGSSLKLESAELDSLRKHGFVIAERERFPNFVYGYKSFYALDLPLFVSADSILYAVHQSYDSLLRRIETVRLVPSLKNVLARMRANFPRLEASGFGQEVIADVDLYLAVASSLLEGQLQSPKAGADPAEVACFLSAVAAENGCIQKEIFGTSRVFDFSQFHVRGHYASDPALSRYFQAMIWLGRTDFRIIETLPGGPQVFRRRQLDAAFALRELIDDDVRSDWNRIDTTVGAFVGEHDDMTLPQLDDLLADLGAVTRGDLAAIDDVTIAQKVIEKGYGAQRILSQITVNPSEVATMPLSSIFQVFGQRYVVDSHVFSNVVFDRVLYQQFPFRMMPSPLDAAFAALANNQAGSLLLPEVQRYGYAPDLTRMRTLVDSHPTDFWQANLYNQWLGALRALSTHREAADPSSVGLPRIAGTEAWGRRLLNTQLASWAELRHDTLLYAKQSYTTGTTVCEYPDAYVEPYPEFWKRLVSFAESGRKLSEELELSQVAPEVSQYFDKLGHAMAILQGMSERQRTGAPHTAEDLAFINQAVRTISGGGCGGAPDGAVDAVGWYAELFLEPADRIAYEPTIADVHTQPTDENGGIVGRVLHVGTGMPRLMVVTADNCSGPRAYVGLASAYFERTTDDFKRLDDQQWEAELLEKTPADVSWMSDLVVR